jgi:16S rRNA (uracil1498-N3)-methyltransferase
MAHIPHIFLQGPFRDESVRLTDQQRGHLSKVLRRSADSEVSYTDGAGLTGVGVFDGDSVVRGTESAVERPSPVLCMAVAPPRSKDRARFVVEKLAELGVDELRWVKTRFGQSDPPASEKARSWAIGALEQSRGAWLLEISGPTTINELERPVLVADLTGSGGVPPDVSRCTVLVGPEGGFEAGELTPEMIKFRLSDRVLRTETAALVGAFTVLKELAR